MLASRRTLLKAIVAATVSGAATGLAFKPANSATVGPLQRRIPTTGEEVPVVGLGSWITFNVGNDPVLLDECAAVIAAFFEDGGRMIDSSPMYGSSQSTIGYGLRKLGYPQQLFSADKVWTSLPSASPQQMEDTRSKWGVQKLDLMQVHNLLAWEEHLDMLKARKAAGEIKYIGVTTSHGRRHNALEQIMKSQDLDFVQITYNIIDRQAEARLLPLARERSIGVIVNRPYQRGDLISRFSGEALPRWAGEIGASSWAQFLLKFIIGHPAVTCAIPATTRVDHVRENLATAAGILPDEATRRRMAEYVGQL